MLRDVLEACPQLPVPGSPRDSRRRTRRGHSRDGHTPFPAFPLSSPRFARIPNLPHNELLARSNCSFYLGPQGPYRLVFGRHSFVGDFLLALHVPQRARMKVQPRLTEGDNISAKEDATTRCTLSRRARAPPEAGPRTSDRRRDPDYLPPPCCLFRCDHPCLGPFPRPRRYATGLLCTT